MDWFVDYDCSPALMQHEILRESWNKILVYIRILDRVLPKIRGMI